MRTRLILARGFATDFSAPKFAAFQKRLAEEAAATTRVTGEWFVGEGQKLGLSEGEARAYLEHLHHEGSMFHFEEGGADFVFLETSDITNTLSGLLDPSGALVRDMVRDKEARLAELSGEMEEMTAQKRVIEKRADQSVRRIMWGIVAYMGTQTVVVTRLTFWDLSWDIMEPITYMVSVGLGAMGVWWFGITKKDPAYSNVWDTLSQSRARRFARKLGFDEQRYTELQTEISRTQEDLALWQDGTNTVKQRT